jgi:predicted DNA-binding transcriptional regulator AlpA
MARPQTIHPDPSRNGAPPRAQTAASVHQGHETNSRREPPPPWIRTGLPQTIRRNQLRLLVPLADSTIYAMEQRGQFPRRFSLTSRCVVWDLAEVEAWGSNSERGTPTRLAFGERQPLMFICGEHVPHPKPRAQSNSREAANM